MGDPLNGELGYIFLISIVDAAILSWITLRWYRHRVAKIMGPPAGNRETQTDARLVPTDGHRLPAAASQPLKIAQVVPSNLRDARLERGVPNAVWKRLVVAYVTGASLHSLVMTFGFFLQLPTAPSSGLVAMFWVNLWPVLPALSTLLAYEWVRSVRLLALYLMCGSAAVALVTFVIEAGRGELTTAPVTSVFWAAATLVLTAFAPFTLLVVTGLRRIRAVMPLALASTLLFGIGLLLFRRVLVEAFDIPGVSALLAHVMGVASVPATYYALFLVLVLPVGWLAWRVLRWLADAYDRKRFSDIQLVVDCWVVVVTAAGVAIHLAGRLGLGGVAVGMAAFAAYRAGVALSLKVLPLRADHRIGQQVARLLLLRVFGYQTRTEQLFDRIAQQWRLHGPVQLIAGRDLAMRTADPGNILAFISGRLTEQFVSSPAEISGRISSLDFQRDPDGRFRVNDVYCVNQTWQSTLQALLTVTDVVVMDLRGFSKNNSGCRFELEQLLTRPQNRMVLIADETTDKILLTDILRDAWACASIDRATRQTEPIAVVSVERNSRRELAGVMSLLLGGNERSQVPTLSEYSI